MRRITAMVIAAIMVFCMFPIISSAADGTISTDGTYDISDYGNDSIVTINPGLTITLTNTGNIQYTNIRIICGAGVALTIDNLDIDDSLTANACPLSFTGTGNTLNLIGTNTLSAGEQMPGIGVSDSSLEIMGTGSINAVGGNYAAGIGAGYYQDSGSITISGGTVTTAGGEYGAGIGGGYCGTGGSITITGGIVTPTAGRFGAGIGGGHRGGALINISGGTIDATAGYGCPGIGSGWYGAASTINISGGNIVNSTGGDFGCGIGGGEEGETTTINISDGTVNATGGIYGAGMGGSDGQDGGNITISGGTVITQGGSNGAGIGGGSSASGGTIRIEGGTVTTTGGGASAGIGGGHSGSGGNITISNGNVTTTGGWGGAGAGSGAWVGDGGNITISGGNVTATGGGKSAGIGGGFQCGGGSITITGGTVAARMGYSGQHDIGDGGDGGTGGTFRIWGDAVAFLKNNSCLTPITTFHTKYTITEVTGGQVYGIDVPAGWTPGYSGFGVLLLSHTLSYDANEGLGTVPEAVTQPEWTSILVADGSGLTNGRLRLINWNTEADLSGMVYPTGSNFSFSEDKTLYANWQRVDVTSVTLSEETLIMLHHDTAELTAEVLPDNASYPEVTWESSNDAVVIVDQSGNIEAVGVGEATITATADGVSDTCAITVNKRPVTSVTLSEETLTMEHHDTAVLTADVLPSNATYPEVTWETSNAAVVTVDQSGNIEAMELGNVVITATADGISDTCNITVNKKPVTSVTLSQKTLSMVHHDTAVLTAEVLPGNATYPEVTWMSDNESVATVDSNGLVTAVSLGSATITATADGVSDTCAVTVTKKPVTSVTLNANTLDMIHHDMVTLTAEVLPSNATYTDIIWTSSNESIATVSSTGVVEAVGVGDAIITATADGISDTCEVTVAKKPVTSVTLSKDTLELIHHDTTTLTATVLPVDATYTDVTWTSSDSSVATVDSSGIVVAAGVGSTIITVTADGVSDVCTVTVNKKPVDSVTLSEETMTMLHHDTAVLTTEVLPINASYPEVTWETSNSSVVTVDQNGNIEAVGVGSVVITATADGVSDTCAITVNKRPVTSVTLSEETLTIEHHDKVRLTAEVLPSNATYPKVTWDTSNSAVVTVEQNGNIEAAGLGNAVITATADGISDTCNITVNKKPVQSVTLSKETLTMEHHDTVKLIAEVLPGNATYPDVVWESSDDTIVSVDQNGNIEAISLGCATITATADGVSDTCEVTVNKKPVASVTLNSIDETVFVGDVVTLAADILPINSTYPEVTWESSDETVATVDENGVVTSIKGGRVTITATADSVSADCNIFVVQPVTLITLSSSSKTVIHHDTLTLLAEVLPDDATYPDVTWTTSNKNVATVDHGGKVTAVGVGSAKITATADGVSEICSITVNKNPVTDVTMNENELSLVHHDTVLLTASVMPSNATYPQITWVSSDPSVVTIDESGRISAVGLGSAKITATADEVTTVCDVTVNKNPVTSVALNETSITLITGGTFKLIASVVPNNATYSEITWESSNPSVAEVNDSGVVTAISTGSAVVTAEADGIALICEVTVQPKSDKTVTITGVLTDENGKPLIGKIVELHSDPMSTVTDKEGRFTFENVCVEHHTLIIMDTAGDPLKEFEIDLNTEEEFTWEEDENTCVNIMLSKDTAAINLSISLNDKDFGIIGVQDVTYPIKKPGSIWKYIVIATALLLAVLVGIYAVLKIKRRSTS